MDVYYNLASPDFPAKGSSAFSKVTHDIQANRFSVSHFNHSNNQEKNIRCTSKFRFFYSFLDVRDSSNGSLSKIESKSLPNLVIKFTCEAVDDYESKYCLTNPLNNVPWAKDSAEKSEDTHVNRVESPTEPDLSTWAALFLENNPSY